MTESPQIFFDKSLEQVRLLGAWGGRTYSRNQRVRRALAPPPLIPQTALPSLAPHETVAQAIRALDAQFPWLSGTGSTLSQHQQATRRRSRPGLRRKRRSDTYASRLE